MKAFQTLFKLLRSSHGSKLISRTCFSTSSCSYDRKKKVNPYKEVDQEKYSNLVRSVLSFRGPAQTPESLFQEDAFLYGPVSKSKLPAKEEEAKTPQNCFPLFNPEKSKPNSIHDSASPLKIPLHKSTIPSVTRILQQTMTKEQIFYLERWKQRMILELGEDGFAEYTSNIFLQGKQFHKALESLLSPTGNEQEKDEKFLESGYIDSVQNILKDIRGVQALESAVQHEALKYVGLLDCVAEYQGKLCVIDWKTSEKPKPLLRNTFDNPLQVVAYIGAINHDANYSFQVHCGLIVVAYKDGSPAHAHFMDSELCSKYWAKWLLRLEEYTKNKNQHTQNIE